MKRKQRKPGLISSAGPYMLSIAGVLLLVAAVFVLKERRPVAESAASQRDVAAFPTAADVEARSQPAPAMAVAETPVRSAEQAGQIQSSGMLPEAQLDHHLESGWPVLAFFHSNTCTQCIRMTEIVAQVYPDYADSVALVDVNVYDQRNQNLLGRVGIQVIPTLIFINRDQQGQGYTGVMPAEALREQLELLRQERQGGY